MPNFVYCLFGKSLLVCWICVEIRSFHSGCLGSVNMLYVAVGMSFFLILRLYLIVFNVSAVRLVECIVIQFLLSERLLVSMIF